MCVIMIQMSRSCVKVNATGPQRRLMANSDKLSLSCAPQFYSDNGTKIDKGSLWKTCIWKRNSDGATCLIEGKDNHAADFKQCDSSIRDFTNLVGGDRAKCAININIVKLIDNGTWTCSIEKCKHKSEGGCEHKDSGECSGEDSVNVQVNFACLRFLLMCSNHL